MSPVARKLPAGLAISGTPGPATRTQAYAFTPAITGGVGPYTCTSAGAALPAGLSMDSATGAVSGAPSVSATTAGIAIHVADSTAGAPLTADLTFSIVVSDPLTISGAPGAATQGAAYSFTPTAAGGRGTKTFALTGALPEGLAFSSTSGAITGAPTTAGVAAGLDVTVTDADGRTASLGAFSLTVGAAGSNSPSTGAKFNRDTIIKAPQLGVANSTQMVVFWSMFGTAYTGSAIQDGFAGVPCMQSDPNTNGEVTAGLSPGICSPAFENYGIGQLNYNTAAGATAGVDDIKFELTAPNTAWFTPGRWNSYLLTWDSATGDWAIYWADGSQADMVDLRAAGVALAASLPAGALCDLNNVNGLMIGASTFSQGPGANGALDSIYIAAGETLCDGTGGVSTADLRKFYAGGKVQDLTAFPTGRQPEVLVTFDPATGAVINNGAGAAFAVTNSLFSRTVSSSQGFSGQENPRLERFPWGPGQAEPSTPHYRFTIEDGGLGIVTQTNSTQVLQPNGFPIAVGDVLIFGASMNDRNGAFNHDITLPDLLKTAGGANQPNGWTSTTGGNVYPNADRVAFNGGVKIADAADVRMADSYAGRDTTLLAASSTSVSIPGAPALPNGGAAFDMSWSTGKGFVTGDVVEVWGDNAVNDRGDRFWATVNSYDPASGTANLTPICSQGSAASYTHWTINLGGWRWNWTMSGGTGSAPGDKLQCGQAFMHVYGGVSAVGAVGHANSTAWAGSTAIATGGLTTSHADALVVSCWLTADAGPHVTPHAGATYAERYKTLKRGRTASSGVFCALADEAKASPGPYASQLMDIKATDGSSAWNGYLCGFNVELA